jgi:large subunit ribosomal protein L3
MISRVRSWNKINDVKLLGFAGYKAGMTQLHFIDNRSNSPTKGEEIRLPVTVLETPALHLLSIRLYSSSAYGSSVIGEVWSDQLNADLSRRLKLPKKRNAKALEELQNKLDDASEVRVLVYTEPKSAAISKKKPDVMELAIGGKDVKEQFEYAKSLIGKPIDVGDIFSEGDLMDAVAVTTGKGFQGSVKRFGVSILHRKSHGDGRRKVASLGNWMAKTWRVPHPGQMGFHNRTVMSLQLIKIANAKELAVTPKGGFLNYGEVKGNYVLIAGSLPGPKKRLIRLNFAKRKRSSVFESIPENIEISMESQQ